ncbi:WAT1-related protein At2g40900-like [Musa acuminata AAA Group]|uniref:WAT1-related protein At2g40900-like n=1 Tax=Musa acuminata AAA Group TaxID=214697 RepID=UPI0031D5FD60
MGGHGEFMRRARPYLTMITLQFGYAGKHILSNASRRSGGSQYVIILYSHAFATLSMAPLAFIIEGPVMDQIFYHAGLKHTSVIFSSAMSSISPAMTFVVAVLSGNNWFMGSGFHILATLASASLSLLQEETLKQYSARLSLLTLIYLVGTLQAAVVTFVLEHKPAVWTIGFDINFLAAAYAGIVTSSVAYYVEGRVIEKRGAVFASAFNPLRMIIVAIMGASFLNEKIYLGGVLGAVLVVIGLYYILWGNNMEE